VIAKNKIRKLMSSQNDLTKRWKKLHTKKGRFQLRTLLIEGEHLIKEAIRGQIPVRAVIINEEKWEQVERFLEHEEITAPIYVLPTSLFATVVETETPQGIAAEIDLPDWKMEEFLTLERPADLFLVLDAIQDPGNLGTIIRTAEAANVSGIFLGKGTVDPFNSKVVRSAMGSLFRLPLFQVELKKLLPQMREMGVRIVGTSPHAELYHFQYSFPTKVAILLGNEGRGLDPALSSWLDTEVVIPMPGNTESLNVAVTSAILLYEHVRQRLS
jgi:RNA methyltransferase, TrmH family